MDNCYVRRRAECSSLGPRLDHLRSDTSLAAKRRADVLHLVQQNTSPARELLLLCVYFRVIHSRKRRALGALVSLFSRSVPGPSPRRTAASCSLAAVRRTDCVHATWLYSFIVQRIDRYSYSYFFCVPRTAAVRCRLCSARVLFCSCRQNKYNYSCKIETGF